MIIATAQFYDGKHPVAREVQVRTQDEGDKQGILIGMPNGETLFWDYETLREQSSDLKSNRMILSPADNPNQFISITHEPLVNHIRACTIGSLQKDFQTESRWLFKLWMWLGVSGVLILVLLYGVIPPAAKYIAPHIPYTFEKELGDAVFTDLADVFALARELHKDDTPLFCEADSLTVPVQSLMRDIHAAILKAAEEDSTLRRRAENVGMPRITIVNSPIVNALALPGDRILLFRGLMEKSVNSFDSLSVVLAHETAHLMKRHNMRGLLADSAALLLMEAVVGGLFNAPLFGNIASGALIANYTLEMETEADSWAALWASAMGADVSRGSDFFIYIEEQIAKELEQENAHRDEQADNENQEDWLPSYLRDIFMTHPHNEDRIEFFQRYAAPSQLAVRYGSYDAYKEALSKDCPYPKNWHGN